MTIEKRSVTDGVDSAGAPLEEWTTLISLFASKEDVSGRERFQANQLSAHYDSRWVINYRADMDPELLNVPKLRRIVYKNRVHDIVHARHVGVKDGVELLTLAGMLVAA